MKLDVDAIIVNYNRAEYTIKTIDSLRANNELNSIIVVDNGSDDIEYLDDLQVDKIIKNSTNIGQAAALNQAFVYANSKYIIAMHNDIVINDPGWVKRAVDFLDTNKEAGLVSVLGWRSGWFKISNIEGVVKNYPDAAKLFDIEGDFVEVTGTDSFMNIYRNLSIKANPKFNIVGVSFFLNYLNRGYKIYTMKVSNATHLRGSSPSIKVMGSDGKHTEAYLEHRENVHKVHIEMLKELKLGKWKEDK